MSQVTDFFINEGNNRYLGHYIIKRIYNKKPVTWDIILLNVYTVHTDLNRQNNLNPDIKT